MPLTKTELVVTSFDNCGGHIRQFTYVYSRSQNTASPPCGLPVKEFSNRSKQILLSIFIASCSGYIRQTI